MQIMTMRRHVLLALLSALPVAAVRQSSMRVSVIKASGKTEMLEESSFKEQSSAKAAVSATVRQMLTGKTFKLHQLVQTADKKLTMNEAVDHLEETLPTDVASLVRLSSSGKTRLDENSMQKARRILNTMVEDAIAELDDLIFELKEFEDRNRGTYEQVMNDLSRLGSQLGQLGEKRVNAAGGITSYDEHRETVEEEHGKVEQNYMTTRLKNQQQLTKKRNDLAVFDFVLNATRCEQASALLQQGSKKPAVSLCNTQDGVKLNFANNMLESKVEQMLSPEARLALRSALGEAGRALSLLETGAKEKVTTTSSSLSPSALQPAVEVAEEPNPDGQWKKCIGGQANCGLLHDMMSDVWGEFKDEVDDLTAEMTKNQEDFDRAESNFNQQYSVISDAKTKYMEILAETISAINADTEESNEKEEQKRELAEEYEKVMTDLRQQIEEIAFTKICAVRTVRNGLLTNSSTSPPSAISDCDVGDWEYPGLCHNDEGVAITCDDSCPKPDPYLCGGKELLTREVVVQPNEFGIKCPTLQRLKRCAQKKCPVNCGMSTWSGWSKCTKDCEGGVQLKTRSVLVKPKNGGAGCDSPQEERSCNTGSCDRDCTLEDWTEWTPCSVACGGGYQGRTRAVLVPTRGQGRCPKPRSRRRWASQMCNTKACVGDEICIAQQDLIIALDASGSLKSDGFSILKEFSVNLTRRYKARYFGLDAVKIGAVLFGNGHLSSNPDGTTNISAAIKVSDLTSNFDSVRTALAGTTWQRGFTNLAQGLSLAEQLLRQGGRESAQSAVLVLWDGKASFKYQTAQRVQELKDKNVQIFMAPVTEFRGRELRDARRWASRPWRTNYQRVPGLLSLQHNTEIFIDKFITKFCPDSISPSSMQSIEAAEQYMLIHENGWPSDACGQWYFEGQVSNIEACAELARNRGLKAFSFGRGVYAARRCYSEAIAWTQSDWDTYSSDRTDPPCPNGQWLFNPYYDTYVINPASFAT